MTKDTRTKEQIEASRQAAFKRFREEPFGQFYWRTRGEDLAKEARSKKKRAKHISPPRYSKENPFLNGYDIDNVSVRPKLIDWLCTLYNFPLPYEYPFIHEKQLLELLYEYHVTIVGEDGFTPDYNQENIDETRLSNVITQIKTLFQPHRTESASQERDGPSDARWLSPVKGTPDFLQWMSQTREYYDKHGDQNDPTQE